jgi:ADP-heptose:LPS heptosyltransferase
MNKNILVLRFSAMGDVALVVASIAKIQSENKNVNLIIVSRDKFKVFFENYPNVSFFSANFDGKHKGFLGLFRLFLSLKKLDIHTVIDLHQNLRTSVLKFFFFIINTKTFTLDKGRNEKKKLVKNISFKPLKHTLTRYLEVFEKAKIISSTEVSESLIPILKPKTESFDKINNWLEKNELTNQTLIGIAPFAQHKGKIWPIEKYNELLKKINDSNLDLKILFFGGGQTENDLVNHLIIDKKNTINTIGKFNLSEEIALISKLSVLVCSDSANMHFAALTGVKTLSIWGSTHQYAGFSPVFQPIENSIEIPKTELNCRPCSVYGNKICVRGDYACLNWIKPEIVFNQLQKLIKQV